MDEFLRNISGRKPYLVDPQDYFISAVLVPIIHVEGKPNILFEVRPQHLDRQPGEICFPGGRIEKGESPSQTALREASEELGIDISSIKLAGPLDLLVAPVGAVIHPFVGILPEQGKISPDPGEVEEVFTVPLDYFLKTPPGVAEGEVSVRYGDDFPLEKVPDGYGPGWKKRWSFSVYYYEYEERFIWGMTSKILVNFLNIYKNSVPGEA